MKKIRDNLHLILPLLLGILIMFLIEGDTNSMFLNIASSLIVIPVVFFVYEKIKAVGTRKKRELFRMYLFRKLGNIYFSLQLQFGYGLGCVDKTGRVTIQQKEMQEIWNDLKKVPHINKLRGVPTIKESRNSLEDIIFTSNIENYLTPQEFDIVVRCVIDIDEVLSYLNYDIEKEVYKFYQASHQKKFATENLIAVALHRLFKRFNELFDKCKYVVGMKQNGEIIVVNNKEKKSIGY